VVNYGPPEDAQKEFAMCVKSGVSAGYGPAVEIVG